MNTIANIGEPGRLYVTWQPPISSEDSRARLIIAEIYKSGADVHLRYLKDSQDFADARRKGFKGIPAFKLEDHNESVFSQGVLEYFLRRLPPRSRGDFSQYLAYHRLPNPFPGSDFSLLGYTNAKLPGDGFEVYPDFTNAALPLELVFEIAGVRHHNFDVGLIQVGDSVAFTKEPENLWDKNAIFISFSNKKVGYVPKPYLSVFNQWLNSEVNVTATVQKINGTTERPIILVCVHIKNK